MIEIIDRTAIKKSALLNLVMKFKNKIFQTLIVCVWSTSASDFYLFNQQQRKIFMLVVSIVHQVYINKARTGGPYPCSFDILDSIFNPISVL